MDAFIVFIFWYTAFIVVARILILAGAEYPRISENNIGLDTAWILLRLPILFWAAYLIWGQV